MGAAFAPWVIIIGVMKTFEWVAMMAVFVFLTNRCGKSIEKRDWEQSVAYFLLALGLILVMVKNTPSF
jgi:hypothetical protein